MKTWGRPHGSATANFKISGNYLSGTLVKNLKAKSSWQNMHVCLFSIFVSRVEGTFFEDPQICPNMHIFRLHTYIALICPPCSLFVFMSAGTHKRHSKKHGIYGNLRLASVRTANAIVRNFAPWPVRQNWKRFRLFGAVKCRSFCRLQKFFWQHLSDEAALCRAVHGVRNFYWVIEQPLSSTMFTMPEVAFVTGLWGFWLVSTWLGLFGHELQKPTKLLTNMPGAQKHLIQICRLLMSSNLQTCCFLFFTLSYLQTCCFLFFTLSFLIWGNMHAILPRIKRTMTKERRAAHKKRQAKMQQERRQRGQREKEFYRLASNFCFTWFTVMMAHCLLLDS